MDFTYLEPALQLKPLVGSYYLFSMPSGGRDTLRAEIPNLRVFLTGGADSDDGSVVRQYRAPQVVLFGPTYRASTVVFHPDTRVFGAAITPLGWTSLFGLAMDELADDTVELDAVLPSASLKRAEDLFGASDHSSIKRAADTLFDDLAAAARPSSNPEFLAAVTQWLLDPESLGIDGLMERIDVSARQAERLARRHFGAPPKRLQRKFRALAASNKLAWNQAHNWLDAADESFYDQAHFIREFRTFIGCTPTAYIQGPHRLVRESLRLRRTIRHGSPFSLIG